MWNAPCDGQIHVDDLGEHRPEERQEESLGRLAEPGIFHGRRTHDGARVDRVLSSRHGRHVETRELVDRSVVARMVAERPFVEERLSRVDIALEDEVRVSGSLEVDGLAGGELHGALPQEAGEGPLVDAVGQRRRRGVGERGSPPSDTATSRRLTPSSFARRKWRAPVL